MAAMAIIDRHDVLLIRAQAYKDPVRFTLVWSDESRFFFIYFHHSLICSGRTKQIQSAMAIIDKHDVF
jgi:hypothetical protein